MTYVLRLLNNTPPTSIDEVERTLRQLDQALRLTDLSGMHYFTDVYRIITANVRTAIAYNAFDDTDFLREFDTRFSVYYFEALRRHLSGEVTPAAWRMAFDAAGSSGATPAKLLALGVNAHIVNDIPKVLADCNALPQHKKDYKRVNIIIRRSLRQAIAALEPSHRLFDPTHRILRLPSYVVMALLSWRWRYSAWRTYQKLMAQRIHWKDISTPAIRHARWLQRLPF